MNKLKALLAELVRLEGVLAAVVVSRDGFVIDGVSNDDKIDNEGVGAVVAASLKSGETIGAEMSIGALTQSMFEYERGLVVVSGLGQNAVLGVVAGAQANIGNVRYQTKKRTAELLGAL